jgi:hypothetical protein
MDYLAPNSLWLNRTAISSRGYQTLIASVPHKYVTGRLAEKPARPAAAGKGRGDKRRGS